MHVYLLEAQLFAEPADKDPLSGNTQVYATQTAAFRGLKEWLDDENVDYDSVLPTDVTTASVRNQGELVTTSGKSRYLTWNIHKMVVHP